MKKVNDVSLTDAQVLQLREAEQRRVDAEDLPEAPEANWSQAERGRFYRAGKKVISLHLDADILEWFQRHAPGGRYQTEINRVLRQHIELDCQSRRHGLTKRSRRPLES